MTSVENQQAAMRALWRIYLAGGTQAAAYWIDWMQYYAEYSMTYVGTMCGMGRQANWRERIEDAYRSYSRRLEDVNTSALSSFRDRMEKILDEEFGPRTSR